MFENKGLHKKLIDYLAKNSDKNIFNRIERLKLMGICSPELYKSIKELEEYERSDNDIISENQQPQTITFTIEDIDEVIDNYSQSNVISKPMGFYVNGQRLEPRNPILRHIMNYPQQNQ